MILELLTDFFVALLDLIFGWIPDRGIGDLPVIGDNIESILLTMVTTWNAFLVTFPYAEIVWNLFLLGVIPLEIGILILKVVLGNRTPVATN